VSDRWCTRSRAQENFDEDATVPLATPPATYYLLACADDLKKVVELDEETTAACRLRPSRFSSELFETYLNAAA
jgi:hypothetical protein